jgi:hypothetical protein
MRFGDALFETFLLNAMQCCGGEMSDFEDTVIPETILDGNDEDIYGGLADLSSSGGPAARDSDIVRGGRVSARRSPMYAANLAASIVSGPSKDPVPVALRHLYPHVYRSYSLDHDAYAFIEWSKCSGINIWTILSSQHMVVGATKSMAFMLSYAIKTQLCSALKAFIGPTRQEAFKRHLQGDRGIKVTSDLEKLFLECCQVPGVLVALGIALQNYNVTQNHVIRFKPGVFPEVSEVQHWTARVAACMVEPILQSEFHAMANANQSRLAVHEPDLRINSNKQRIIERITKDFVNNPNFIPQSNPSVAEWCDTDYDSSVIGKEPRSWVWVGMKIQEIKTGMTKLMKNFCKSGEGVNDQDHVNRDLEFFENFAKRDALWFWIYLCWDRGNNIPVWHFASLPENESMDLGGGDEAYDHATIEPAVASSSKKNKKRGRNEDEDALTSSVSGLVEVSKRALDAIVSAQGTATVAHHHYPAHSPANSLSQPSTIAVSPEKKRAEDLSAFKEQLSQLVEMKNMLPDNLHGPVDACISKVTRQVHDLVCLNIDDLTA